MTAINVATDIPSQISTLEELAAWACLALANVNPTLMSTEGVGYIERAAQGGIFYVQVENKFKFLGRVSIDVNPIHLAGGQKTWKYMLPISNTALPNEFKSN